MTNEEHQQQARERRYREEREAEQRRSMEELNRRQQEQQARAAEESRKAYSRRLGQMNAMPSIFGPGVDVREYYRGKAEHDAWKKTSEALNPPNRNPSAPFSGPARRAPNAASGGAALGGAAPVHRTSGVGKFLAFVLLGGLAVLFVASLSNTGRSASGNGYSPPSGAAAPEQSVPAPVSPPEAQAAAPQTTTPEASASSNGATPSSAPDTAATAPSVDAAPSQTVSSPQLAAPAAPPDASPPSSGHRSAWGGYRGYGSAGPSSGSSWGHTGSGFASAGQPTSDAPAPAGETASAAAPRAGYRSTWPLKSNYGFGSVAPWAANPVPWPAEGLQYRAHHKGSGGCDGTLMLFANGLEFVCPGDNGRSFSVALGEIMRADKDGIQTLAGRKYHFDGIPGGNKAGVEELFDEWLFRTHLVQTGAQ